MHLRWHLKALAGFDIQFWIQLSSGLATMDIYMSKQRKYLPAHLEKLPMSFGFIMTEMIVRDDMTSGAMPNPAWASGSLWRSRGPSLSSPNVCPGCRALCLETSPRGQVIVQISARRGGTIPAPARPLPP